MKASAASLGTGGLVAATAGGAALLLTAGGVLTTLTATAFNASAQVITSGTLKLTLTNNGVGIPTTFTNMGQGDVVNRYIALTNDGTLAGANLTLTTADATSTVLTSDATNGLQASLATCSVAWTAATGVCGGTTTSILAFTPVATLISTPQAVTGFSTVAVDAVLNLKLSVTLPAVNTDITQNGTSSLGAASTQGRSASMTWTFTEAQRTATTTNS